MATQKISPLKTFKRAGFTLVEIMIVLAILGAISVIGFQNFNRGENLKTSVRKMNTLLREVRQRARLHGKTYRLVIQMDAVEGHSYWVESSSRAQLIDPSGDPDLKKEDKEKSAGDFQMASDILKKPSTLPKGWYFTDIENQSRSGPKSEGKAYITFFPQGIAEESVIHISNKEKTTWTIHVQALKSSPDIYQESKSLKDLGL